MIRVLVADDDQHFRRGLAAVLGTEDDIEIVAEAEHGANAVTKAEELRPDVVLMDLRMPGVGGVEATRMIRRSLPSTQVIVLTVSDDLRDTYEAITAGACGYLLKDTSMAAVAEALRACARGEDLLSRSISQEHQQG